MCKVCDFDNDVLDPLRDQFDFRMTQYEREISFGRKDLADQAQMEAKAVLDKLFAGIIERHKIRLEVIAEKKTAEKKSGEMLH
jgi:hypothetical protein